MPNKKWVADITYIWTKEGGLYLAIIIDLFSREVVGWSMDATMERDMVMSAFIGSTRPPVSSRIQP